MFSVEDRVKLKDECHLNGLFQDLVYTVKDYQYNNNGQVLCFDNGKNIYYKADLFKLAKTPEKELKKTNILTFKVKSSEELPVYDGQFNTFLVFRGNSAHAPSFRNKIEAAFVCPDSAEHFLNNVISEEMRKFYEIVELVP